MGARSITVGIAAALALGACGVEGERVAGSFYREAGSIVDSGSFGNATMRNTLAMTEPERFTIALGERFAAEIDSTITFAFDSAVLDADARATLTQQARWIAQFPEIRFRVYGHTDKVGSETYNRQLGLRRARAAVNFLVAQGISRDRLEAVTSFGETRPLIPTEGRERQNRRTVTEVSGYVASHPTILDGRYAEVIYRGYIDSGAAVSTLTGIQGAQFGTDQ
jgi:outer membrane protein OmpA-like peptidoglycan-associated protein